MSEPVRDTGTVTVMVVDDHPMWREGVARDLTEAGFDVVATASTGTEALTRGAACRPRVVVLDLQIPAPERRRGHRASRQGGPDLPRADPLGVRGAGGRARGREGRLDRLPREVGVAGRAGRRRRPGRRGRPRVHARSGRARARGVPPALRHPPGLDRPRHPAPDRAGDRDAPAGGQGAGLQADRRAAVPLPPNRAEPCAEHPAQAPAAQPGAAGPLRDRAGPRRRRSDSRDARPVRRVPRAGGPCPDADCRGGQIWDRTGSVWTRPEHGQVGLRTLLFRDNARRRAARRAHAPAA